MLTANFAYNTFLYLLLFSSDSYTTWFWGLHKRFCPHPFLNQLDSEISFSFKSQINIHGLHIFLNFLLFDVIRCFSNLTQSQSTWKRIYVPIPPHLYTIYKLYLLFTNVIIILLFMLPNINKFSLLCFF